MKRIVRLVTAAVFLTSAAIPAHSNGLPLGLSSIFLDVVAATRSPSGTARALNTVDYLVSKFDQKITKSFERAWQRSGNGTTSLEGVVLVLRMADGSLSGIDMGATNEYKRFTFSWRPAAVAIVHTHPNSSDPQPCGDDITAADKHGIPIFTITSRGMYVYDPGTRKITKLMNDLEWLERSNRSRLVLGR